MSKNIRESEKINAVCVLLFLIILGSCIAEAAYKYFVK